MSLQLKIYDILGREVAVLLNKQQHPGNYEVEFNSNAEANNYSPSPSGVYFYHIAINSDQLKVKNYIQTQKMMFKNLGGLLNL